MKRHMLGPLLPCLLGSVLVACKTTEPGPITFDGPVSADVLNPSDGGPFEEPIGFVANSRSGRITPIDLKYAVLLSDSSAAPFLDPRGIATGDERQLGQVIVWAPSATEVQVMAVDLAHQVLVQAPYIVDDTGSLVIQTPTSTDATFQDNDGSGDSATLTQVQLEDGWTTTEDWRLDYDGSQWWVTGSASGQQALTATTGLPYRSDQREVAFTVSGTATAGDQIFFSTDTGIVEHDVGAIPLAQARVPGQALALVGTWDPSTEQGGLVLWDLLAGAAVGTVDLGIGAQPWSIEVADSDGSTARVFVADAQQPLVHEVMVDLADPAASLDVAIETAAPVQDVAWIAGSDPQGLPFEHLLVAPAGLNRIDLYDLLTDEWIDANPMDGVDLAGIDLHSPVIGIDTAPDPIKVAVVTPWDVREAASVAAVTTFDGSLLLMDGATGCLVSDIQGARVTTTSGEETVGFTDVGSVSNPSIQPDAATGRKVVTSTCGGLVRSETWTLTYDGPTGTWEVRGSVSGVQNNRLVEDQRYVSDNGGFSLMVLSGPDASSDGDQFQFSSEEGILRLDQIVDAKAGNTPFEMPAKPVIFQYDAGPTGGGWDILDRRTFALLPLTESDLVVRVRLQAWQIEVVWK